MKISRNDACPCGSGKKYKRCCQNTAPGTPLFVHANGERMSPSDISEAGASLLDAQGVHPAYGHALRKLGYMVSERNHARWSPEEIADWQAALDEYCAKHPELAPPPPVLHLPALSA